MMAVWCRNGEGTASSTAWLCLLPLYFYGCFFAVAAGRRFGRRVFLRRALPREVIVGGPCCCCAGDVLAVEWN